MSKVYEAIGILQCAEMNCDNVKKLGTFFADAVKEQIQEAINILEKENNSNGR